MQYKDDSTFTIDEVELIVQEYLPSQDPKIMEMISNTIKKYKRTTSIDFESVKDVIKEVADKTGIFKCISPCLDELQTEAPNRKFTKDEVKRIAHEFVVFQDPKLTQIIRKIVNKFEKPDDMNFNDVKGVIKEVAKVTGLPEEFPSLEELRMTGSNRNFTADEVERIAKEFLAFQDPNLKKIITELFDQHEKPDGIEIKELKGVIKNVITETGTTTTFSGVDKLKKAISDCKFTVEEVETIVNDYLF
ncbi:uncharacterized protein LOC126839906 [Adelges cooleyi]|uniref:uncharacterized protein LOC126839906 n=1 Tax=Adelges cooleyi TaxID=133065 RepID=UPI00217FC655|nr:uncharacterized protein LOC126839906 [Adelges cooleyi]